MDSTRSLSVGSLHSDYHSDELNDHRFQPHSLPARDSFDDDDYDDDDTYANNDSNEQDQEEDVQPIPSGQIQNQRPNQYLSDNSNINNINNNDSNNNNNNNNNRARSQSTNRRNRSMSKSSCAISDNSVDSNQNAGGILLNRHKSMESRKRRLTRSSVASQNDDAGSRISVEDEKNQEDVCFPMINKVNYQSGIDFGELDEFSQMHRNDFDINERNFYKPIHCQMKNNSRPLVPQGFGIDQKNPSPPSSAETTTPPAWSEPYQEKYSYSGEFDSGFNKRRASFTMDRFSFFASESDETIHAPDLASLTDEGQSFKDLFNPENGTWWLDVLDPTDAEMRVIAKSFGIHPLTAEDIKMQEAREKVELFKTYYFVCFHTFDADHESEDFLDSINMHMVVFKDGILSFHFSPVQHTVNVRRRIRQLQDYVNVSSDWICYALIDDITDSFAPLIRELEVETDIIEDSVFVARECDFGRMLRRIGEARKKVMSLLRLLFGKADVIKMFAKRCNERWDNAPRGEIGLYLGDIQDHIVTMYQNLQVYEKIFSRSHGNYLAQLQVESVNSNNRVTKVLGRVTLVGTVLVPLNLVTGLFGMNVKVPGQDGEPEGGDNLAWFFGIIGFMIFVVFTLSLVARRWLGEAESAEDTSSSPRGAAQSIKSGTTSMISKAKSLTKND